MVFQTGICQKFQRFAVLPNHGINDSKIFFQILAKCMDKILEQAIHGVEENLIFGDIISIKGRTGYAGTKDDFCDADLLIVLFLHQQEKGAPNGFSGDVFGFCIVSVQDFSLFFCNHGKNILLPFVLSKA